MVRNNMLFSIVSIGMTAAALFFGRKTVSAELKETEDDEICRKGRSIWILLCAAGFAGIMFLFYSRRAFPMERLLFLLYVFLYSSLIGLVDLYSHNYYLEMLPGLLAFIPIGCITWGMTDITEEQREKVWEVFQKFISLMEERKLYTVGYAISKLMPAIKKRSYKPYGLILADDVHFLNWLKLDFLTVIGKSPLSAYSVDVMQDYYLHCMRDLTNPACSEENLFYGLKNMRMDSEKLKFACPQIMPGMTKLRNDIKGIEIVQVDSCDPAGNIEFEEKLCGIVRSFSNSKDNVIVTADEDEAEDIREILDSRGIKSVIVDDTQSYFDYLLDDGIRICTFLRLGCLTFENVIIADTYEDLMDPNEESGISIPDRYWYFDWTERLGYKMMLFRHSIAASRKTTYLFEPADDQSLVRLYRENVN